jgi:hypothetical protein
MEGEKLLKANRDNVRSARLARQEVGNFEGGRKPVDEVLGYAAEALQGCIIGSDLYK